MSKEVNELLEKLGKLEDAPLIWINKKVYDMSKEIERLNNIINEFEKTLKSHKDLKVTARYGEYYVEIEEVYDYLQELKGSDKE